MDMSNLNTTHHFDVIIVGSGGAGLSLALSLPQHFNIAVLAKSNLTDASTFYAQGGVAAVLDETDSIEQHIDDTMIAASSRQAVGSLLGGGNISSSWGTYIIPASIARRPIPGGALVTGFLCIVAGELDRDIFDKIIFNYLDIL